MAYNTILIKRRLSGEAGAPAALSGGELALNEVDSVLYYGSQAGVIPIGGAGHFATNSLVGSISADLQSQVTTLDSRVTSEVGTLNTTIQSVSSTLDARITSEIAAVIDMAPEALNTLNELASALGDDENFAANLTNTLTNVNSTIASVSASLQSELDSLDSDNSAAVAALSAELKGDVATEQAAREAADSALTSTVQSVSSTLDFKIDLRVSDLESAIVSEVSAEIARATAAEGALDSKIDSEVADLEGRADDLESKTQNIELANTVAGTTEFTGTIKSNRIDMTEGPGEPPPQINVGAIQIGSDENWVKLDTLRVTPSSIYSTEYLRAISFEEGIISSDWSFANSLTVAAPTSDNHAVRLTDLNTTVQSVSSALASDLASVNTRVDNVLSNVDAVALNSLSEIVTAFQEADSDLNGAITSLAGNGSTNLAAVSATLDAKIDSEVLALETTLASVSATLDAAIDAEESARVSDVAALSAAIDSNAASATNYVHANFLPLSGGDLTGELTVASNISASGTITAAGGLEIGGGAGDATLFVDSGMVGIGTETPNEELTVVGSISATEDIFARNGTFTGTLNVSNGVTFTSDLSGNGTSSTIFGFVLDGGSF